LEVENQLERGREENMFNKVLTRVHKVIDFVREEFGRQRGVTKKKRVDRSGEGPTCRRERNGNIIIIICGVPELFVYGKW
jgi:hypothetical protein